MIIADSWKIQKALLCRKKWIVCGSVSCGADKTAWLLDRQWLKMLVYCTTNKTTKKQFHTIRTDVSEAETVGILNMSVTIPKTLPSFLPLSSAYVRFYIVQWQTKNVILLFVS